MRKHLSILKIILAAAILFCSPLIGFAEEDGSGENKGVPLELTYCSIQNGQTNVNVNTTIDLTFSKNVVNMSVAGSNKECFLLQDDKGNTVSIVVLMGDDQVDPSAKKNVSIVPAVPLENETKYTLNIKKNLSSKSGSTLAGDAKILFITAESETVGTPEKPQQGQAQEDQPRPDSARQTEEDSADGQTYNDEDELNSTGLDPQNTDESLNVKTENAKKTELRSTKLTYIVLAAGIILAVFFVIYFRKR